ncbi:MAG TPA: peptidylprolyl isomerase [Silvibacterium sp.]|nr:peptidylprolyl isomerase [Silvibacterium sp.]
MRRTLAIAASLVALILGATGLHSQSAEAKPSQTDAQPVVLDRVVGVINGDVILESDVKEEQRFAELEPFSVRPGTDTLQTAARRLANRTLILQQMKEQQQQLGITVSDEEVQKALMDVRMHLPECRQYHCTTEAGWAAFLAAHKLTEAEVFTHWKQRLTILKFIDLRFRSGIRISNEEIDAYYKKSVVPVYERQKQKPPALDEISQRIQEILLQQQVNGLLQDWLKSLRDEGSVQILDPAYGQNSGHAEEDD